MPSCVVAAVSGVVAEREREEDDRADTRRRVDEDPAAVKLDDLARDHHAEACAAAGDAAARDERQEEAGALLGRHAGTVVGDGHEDVVVADGDAHDDAHARSRVVDGVVDEVPQGLTHEVAIEVEPQRRAAGVEEDGDPVEATHLADGAAGEGTQVGAFEVELEEPGLEAGGGEEVLGHGDGAAGAVDDRVDEGALPVVERAGRLLGEELGGPLDERQRCADLVGEDGRAFGAGAGERAETFALVAGDVELCAQGAEAGEEQEHDDEEHAGGAGGDPRPCPGLHGRIVRGRSSVSRRRGAPGACWGRVVHLGC